MPGSKGRPRSLILDLYGAYIRRLGGWMAVSNLITLMGQLGVDEQAVRSAVSRMTRRGLDGAAPYAPRAAGHRPAPGVRALRARLRRHLRWLRGARAAGPPLLGPVRPAGHVPRVPLRVRAGAPALEGGFARPGRGARLRGLHLGAGPLAAVPLPGPWSAGRAAALRLGGPRRRRPLLRAARAAGAAGRPPRRGRRRTRRTGRRDGHRPGDGWPTIGPTRLPGGKW